MKCDTSLIWVNVPLVTASNLNKYDIRIKWCPTLRVVFFDYYSSKPIWGKKYK